MFEDDFRGRALDRRKWQIMFGGSAYWNNAFDWDHRGIEVNDGLRIRSFRDNGRWKSGGISMGMEPTGFHGWLGGQVDIQARLPAGRGVGVALLLWPAQLDRNGGTVWPPEIDLVEVPSVDKKQVMTTIHWKDAAGRHRYDNRFSDVDATEWHCYGAIWHPGRRLEYRIDGQTRHVFTENVPDIPMSIGLQGFVAGASETWHGGAPDRHTPDPWVAEIKYVRWMGAQQAEPGSSRR
ncbi:family 16 glycosylhydrolase [Falsiroseomonas sp.]|uniref:glycoside hydrolase family 16 protein n=1 Tax=Falsiroseomonas sp. TaxID=2870721 RepID=UPI003569ED31